MKTVFKILCLILGLSLTLTVIVANLKPVTQPTRDASPIATYHQSTPEAAALIAQGERDGLMRLEPERKRAFIASGVWRAADAQRKETLVNMLALECARRRGDESIRLEVLDQHTGRTIASLSQWDGLKIH